VFRTGQDLVIEGDRLLHDVAQALPVGVLAAGPLIQLDAGACREAPQSLGEVDRVALHHEREQVAALATPEALPALAGGCDRETRRLLPVERAQTLEGGPGLAQADALADDLDEVQLALDLGCDADRQWCSSGS
jgi:hypothetical protein